MTTYRRVKFSISVNSQKTPSFNSFYTLHSISHGLPLKCGKKKKAEKRQLEKQTFAFTLITKDALVNVLQIPKLLKYMIYSFVVLRLTFSFFAFTNGQHLLYCGSQFNSPVIPIISDLFQN